MSDHTLPPEIEAALEKYAEAYKDTHDINYGHYASREEARALDAAWATADAVLRALLAPLVADAARLDWLQRNAPEEIGAVSDSGGVRIWRWHRRYITSHEWHGDSIRAAIDAARGAANG